MRTRAESATDVIEHRRRLRGSAIVAVSCAMAVACASREPASPRKVDVAPPPSPAALAAPADATAPLAPSGARVVVPGTGVSLVPPPGVRVRPVGTTLADDEGKVLVSVAVGSAERALDQDPNWLGAFPGAPEAVRVGGLPATLRSRERASSSGAAAFDTWVLDVSAQGRSLTLMVIDKGEDPERWKRWKANALSVEWKPEDVDAEKAFGLSAGRIPGMELDTATAGGLSYRAPPPDEKRITLFVTAFPLVLPDGPEPCFEVLRRSTASARAVGKPTAFAQSGFQGCELDTVGASGKSTYWSVISAPDAGGTVIAIGDAPSSSFATWRPRFAAAVRGLKVTR